MTAEDPKTELQSSLITEALRTEVAARARQGAFGYPALAAIIVCATAIWRDHRGAGLIGVGLLSVVALARRQVSQHAITQPSARVHRLLVLIVASQGLAWGSFVAAIVLGYGWVAVTWLAIVVSAGFAAAGTSWMGIVAGVHRPFLAAMSAPIAASALVVERESGATLVVVAVMYLGWLLRAARQHAAAYEALLRAQHALRLAREQARAAEQAKSAYVALIGHKLRAPMHAAVGSASMLLETALDDRQRRYAETIAHAGATLVELIHDARAISRMDAQGTQLHASAFEPNARVEERSKPASAAGGVPAGTRVLVVDDSRVDRELAQEMLEWLGCVVETAGNGADAIAACRAKPFTVVLMDCQMQELDGYATTRQLRMLDGALAQTPIVAVTADAFDDDERRRALEAGMNDVLAKPFSIRELHCTLGRWVAAVGEPRPTSLAAIGPRAPSSLYPHAMQHIAAMLDGALDDIVMDRVIEAFLQQWPQRLAALESALRDNQLLALRESIHALEGAVPYFGIERLNAALQRFQQQARSADLGGARATLHELAVLVDALAASRKRHRVPLSV